MYVAEHYLGLKTVQRPVRFDELKDFAECGICGTAAVSCPVGRVVRGDEEVLFPTGMEKMGPITQKLYDTLVGIQYGTVPAPEGWIHKIC
jgi:branched-chain amino acid aminotransferase